MIVCLMVINATLNNISVLSWRSVLLVEETAEHRENHRPIASHWQTLSHNVVHLVLIKIWTQWWFVNPTITWSRPRRPLNIYGMAVIKFKRNQFFFIIISTVQHFKTHSYFPSIQFFFYGQLIYHTDNMYLFYSTDGYLIIHFLLFSLLH